MVVLEYLNWPYQYFKYPYVVLLIIPLFVALQLFLNTEWFTSKKVEMTDKWRARRKHLRRIVAWVRPMIILLLLFAVASPFTEKEQLIEGDVFLRMIFDNTTSFELFDSSVGNKLRDELATQIRVESKELTGTDKTPLGDTILSSLQNNGNILLVSDGQNNFGADLGDIALYAQKLNATINAIVLEPIHADAKVSIKGPSKTLQDIDNTFSVKITRVGNVGSVALEVKIDGQVVYTKVTSEEAIDITRAFTGGYHTIEAKISPESDYFPENNIFYKTVKVVKKPKLLFLSKEVSPMETLLSQLYEVTQQTSLPRDLEKFSAVILNDFSVEDINDAQIDRIIDFVADGNGFMTIGGRNSYEFGRYKDSRLETLLPVFVASPGKEEGDINIVMVIDISGSTGHSVGGGVSAVDVEKAQALSILGDLKPENKLAVVAFNRQAFVIEPMSYIFEKQGITKTIASLKDGGGTLISVGLFEALELLKPTEGSKNIILISDGITQLLGEAEKTAKLAAKMGTKIYTVSVGSRSNDKVMAILAQMTNGIFFKADQSHRLRILFGDPEAGDRDRFGVTILNNNHFITEQLEIRAIITGYNQVVPKATANLLVTTDVGDPLLTVWRYGLGRIASMTTDDGTYYAGSLLSRNNSLLITRTMNWIIGDPDRKSESFIDITDSRLGEPTPILVKSPTPPKAEDVIFYKMDKDLYRGNIVPQELGFHRLIDATFAVNAKREFDGVGMNPEMEDIVKSTGGKMYSGDDAEKIVKEVRSRSKRSVIQKVYIRWPFMLAALLLLLAEIYLRRLTKNKKAYK